MKLELNVSFNASQDRDRSEAPDHTEGPRIDVETGTKLNLRALLIVAVLTSNISIDQLVGYLTQL